MWVMWAQSSPRVPGVSYGRHCLTCPAGLGGPPGNAGSERPVWACPARPWTGTLLPGTGCPPAVGREEAKLASQACPQPGLHPQPGGARVGQSTASRARKAQPVVQGARATPWGKSIQGRRWGTRCGGVGAPRGLAGAPGAGSGQASPPRQGQDDPGFCLQTCEPARDNVGSGGEAKERKLGWGRVPCHIIQPLPTGLNKGPPLSVN